MLNVNPTVPWYYPLIILSAPAAAVGLACRDRNALILTPRQRIGLSLGAFCGAMIGGKLPFALADWHGLLSGRVWFESGKTIVFALVGGYFGVEFMKRRLGVVVKTGDGFAVPVAAAVGIGRLGCFAAGCCHGTATSLPWGVDFGDGVRRHPTHLYECAFHISAACVLAALKRRGLFKNQLIKLYILAYLNYRFATEFIRPEPVLAFGLTGYQWAALALMPVFAALWIRDAHQPRTPAQAF